MTIVNLSRTPITSTSCVGHNSHGAYLKGGWESASSASSSPSGDLTALTGIVSGIRGSESNITDVGVSADGSEVENGYVIGVTTVAIVLITRVSVEL